MINIPRKRPPHNSKFVGQRSRITGTPTREYVQILVVLLIAGLEQYNYDRKQVAVALPKLSRPDQSVYHFHLFDVMAFLNPILTTATFPFSNPMSKALTQGMHATPTIRDLNAPMPLSLGAKLSLRCTTCTRL
jgi:hypothetical protein